MSLEAIIITSDTEKKKRLGHHRHNGGIHAQRFELGHGHDIERMTGATVGEHLPKFYQKYVMIEKGVKVR